MRVQSIFNMFQYLPTLCSIDIIARDFNYDLLKVLKNKLLGIFTDQVQTVNKPTHISRPSINHFCITKALAEIFFSNITVKNNYLSDHNLRSR